MRILLSLLALLAGSAYAQTVTDPQPLALVCAYNSAIPSPSNGTFFYVQCDSTGKLITSGAVPGGTNGQVQYNNSGAFGGFTVGGDGTLNTSTGSLIVTKTNGVSFGTAATQNTGTSGANIPLLNAANTWSLAQTFSAGVSSSTFVTAGGASYLGFNARTIFDSSVDGVIRVSNWAQTDFTRLQLGGTTSSFPAIKRSAATLAFRLADDSADAAISSAAITASGKVTGPTATTSLASFNAPHGTAPTSPADGDIWTTTAGMYLRINGATSGPFVIGTSGATICLNNAACTFSNNMTFSGLSYFVYNSAGAYPSTANLGLAPMFNFSNAAGEVDFFNTYTSATDSFRFYQQTGASAATLVGTLTTTAAIFPGEIRTGSTTLHRTTVALTDGAGSSAGTLTNAPAVGNPTKWIPINDNGTTRYIPAW